MRILFVNDKFPPERTVVGRIIYELAQFLKDLGHEIFIFTTNPEVGLSKIESYEFDGLKIFKTGRLPDEKIMKRSWRILYNPGLTRIFLNVLSETKADIVHFHNIHQYLGYPLFKCAKQNTRAVFLTTHDVQLFHYGKLIEFINPRDFSCPGIFNYKISWPRQILRFRKRFIPFRRSIIRYYLKYIDKIFAVSGALKDALAQNGIKNVEIIHNGINVSDWEASEQIVNDFKNRCNLSGKKIILFGGRIDKLKGGEQIIRAMSKVSKKIPEAVLMVLGERSGYVQTMLELAKKYTVEKNIINTGWLSGDFLKAAFYASDVVIMSSICLDTFGMVNVEAMACKKPVVATCFGGSREVVLDGETGYIVNPFDIEEMAGKIVYLLNNPDIAKKLGEAGYERVKKEFNLEKMVNNYLSWYNENL